MLAGRPGYLYLGSLFIEDASGWNTLAPGYGKGHWYTLIGRADYQSDDLETVERVLYQFATTEGYC